MTIKTEKFIRKVKPVDAVRVTEDDLSKIAGWCRGLVIPAGSIGDDDRTYIHVPVTNPRNEDDSKAYVDSWIIKESGYRGDQFKVIGAKQFKNAYEAVAKQASGNGGATPKSMPQKKSVNPKQERSEADPTGLTLPTPDPQQTGAVEVHRSAKSGQFVTEAEAEQNPDTTVAEHIEKKESNVQEDEMSGAQNITPDDHVADELNGSTEDDTTEESADDNFTADVVPGDMHDATQSESDEDGTVQLGVPVESAEDDVESDDEVTEDDVQPAPSLCGQCGSQVVDGVCSNDINHDINGQAPAAPRVVPGD